MPTKPKPSRRTRAELKQMILEAGREVLLELEPTMGLEGLTYSVVFDHLLRERDIRVTTGSVHERIWHSQNEFQLDVLANAIADTPQRTFDVAQSGVVEALEQANLETVQGRKYATQEVIRLLQNFSAADAEFAGYGSIEEKLAFITRLRLWEFDQAHDATAAIAELVLRHREEATRLYVEMGNGLMQVLGLRKTPAFADTPMELLAVLGNATPAGLLIDPLPIADSTVELPTGPNGEPQQWHPTSIALWALVRNMFEIDDDSLSEVERRL